MENKIARSIPNKNLMSSAIFSVSLCLFLSLLVFFIPGVWDQFSSNIARYRAIRFIDSMPVPPGAENFGNTSDTLIRSYNCSKGNAYTLLGTNVDVVQVEQFYKNVFQERGFTITYNHLDPDNFYLVALGKNSATHSTEIVGEIRKLIANHINALTEGMYSPGMFDKSIQFSKANDGFTKYKGLYLISISYTSPESQNAMCWMGGG